MASELMINFMGASSDIATKVAEILIDSIWLDSNTYSLEPFRNQLFKPLGFHADTFLKFVRGNIAPPEIESMHFQFTTKMVKVGS